MGITFASYLFKLPRTDARSLLIFRMAAETSVSWEVGATEGGKSKGLEGKVADRELARRRLITTIAQLGDIQKGLHTSILVAVASVYVETRRMPQKVALEPSTRCATLNFSTLHPQISTLNIQPSTLNPQHSTRNPQPSTFNPQPSTLSSQNGRGDTPGTLYP